MRRSKVAWGLQRYKYFTQACNDLLVVTDHNPLVKMLGDRTFDEISNTRIFLLKQRTLPWSFDIAHLPEKTNSAADATSRHPSPANEFAELRSLSLHSEMDDGGERTQPHTTRTANLFRILTIPQIFTSGVRPPRLPTRSSATGRNGKFHPPNET